MKFKIVTPERIMLETEVESLTLPTTMGEITVLPNHIPLVAQLIAGEIKYKEGSKDHFFAVSGGIIEVSAKGGSASGGKNSMTEVVVLADSAEFGHEVDIQRAEQAREIAKKLMSESYRDEKTYADATAVFEKNLARLKVARKHHTHKAPKIEN